MSATVTDVEVLTPLHGLAVDAVAPFVEDSEKDARLEAVRILAAIAGGAWDAKTRKTVRRLGDEALARLRKACEKAAKDKDETVQAEANEALESLKK
jgi:hypothetical protein